MILRYRPILRHGALATVLLLLAGGSLGATAPRSGVGAPAVAATAQAATLHITVRDQETDRPMPGVVVRLRGLDRAAVTDSLGVARFAGLPIRPVSIVAEPLGFAPAEQDVMLTAGAPLEVVLRLRATALQIAGVVVTATGRERGIADVFLAATSLSGVALQRAVTSSVPASLDGVPGFRSSFNGPGATRPTIRGLSGDRVLVLEDGARTGDLYQSSADHGVMVEALTAERLEVVRGPAGLLYGANTLGGVVNVVRDDVPRRRPDAVTGAVSSQFESVNTGRALAGVVSLPLGPFAVRVEGSGRRLDGTQTPLGVLDRTSLRSTNGSVGASWVRPETGFVGLAARLHDSRYGVPGEFGGVLIPGGHPNGVEIATTRRSLKARGAWTRPVFGFFDGVEADASATHYTHDEIEGQIDGRTVLGARFVQDTRELNVLARHDHALHDHPERPLRAEGVFGVTLRERALVAGGVSPGSRTGSERTAAAFVYEEFARGASRLQLGARVDQIGVTPRSLAPVRVRTQQREVVKPVTARDFTGLSGSIALLRELREGWTAGATVSRAFRAPTLEELYSDGPHLADFSFDIGTPTLRPEVGTGLDLFLRGTASRVNLELAAYVNRVDGFLYYAQTGETVRVLRDGADPRITPVFEARGDDALFLGGEGRVQWAITPRLVLDGTASYTRATRRAYEDPLPFIPPLHGRAEARYEQPRGLGKAWFAALGVDATAAQQRVPRPIRIGDVSERPQEPTAGFGLLSASVGWRTLVGAQAHLITVQGRNLSDRAWRDHLSRIKDVAPQPGRTIVMTYRVQF
jgi:iron complex outermembrane receptor protein